MQSALVTIYQIIRQHIQLIKRFSLLLLSSITLTACASTNVEGISVDGEDSLIVIKNTSIFEQCLPQNGVDLNSSYFIGVRCLFKDKAPDKFTITYAVWFDNDEDIERFYGRMIERKEPKVNRPKGESGNYDFITVDGQNVSKTKWREIAHSKRKQAIAQLPASAWQTYTVDVKSTLKKYEGKTPEGNPMGIAIPIGWGIYYPSLFPNLKDRTLSLDIRIDKEGNVKLKEEYRWENELPNNPYS